MHITRLVAHDELELAHAESAIRVAEGAVAGDAVEVRLRHVQLGPKRLVELGSISG
jgi:hypothetical protein